MSQDALAKRIRKLQRQKKNRLCFDCGDRGPNNVCVPFGIFVCDQCAGVHRSFTHRIKGISMSRWSEEEVSELEEKGNIVGAKTYLKGWDEDRFPRPDSNDKRAIKEWIKAVYENKRFFKKSKKTKKSKTKKEKKKKSKKKVEKNTQDDEDDWAAFDKTEKNDDVGAEEDDDDWAAFDKVEKPSKSSKKKIKIKKRNSDDAWDPFNGGGSTPAAETTTTNDDEFAGFADAFADTGSNDPKVKENKESSSNNNADKISDVFASLSFSEPASTTKPPQQNGGFQAGMMMGGNQMGGNMMMGNNMMQPTQQQMMMMGQNGGGMMTGPMGGTTTATKKTSDQSTWRMDIGSDLLPFKSKPQPAKPPAQKMPSQQQQSSIPPPMMMTTPGMMTMPQQSMMTMPQTNMMMGNNMMQQQNMMMGHHQQNTAGMMMMGGGGNRSMMQQQQVKPQGGGGFNPFDSPTNTQQKVPQQASIPPSTESNNPFDMF